MNLIEFQLLKSRSGVYKDTPENRRLHRVGQRYGVQKVDEVVEIKNYFSQKVIPNVNSFRRLPMVLRISLGYELRLLV